MISRSDPALSSLNSNQVFKRDGIRQSRDSDRTTHKEIYIKRESEEFPEFEEMSQTIFTPNYQEDTIRNSYRRNRSERSKGSSEQSNQNNVRSSRNSSHCQENDSSSSVEPLSSRLNEDRIARYEYD